jgi:N6-adenosine-specific RNA methylase IME4
MPRTVMADPPWWPKLHANTVGRYQGKYRAGPQRYYQCLTVEQIIALKPETQAKAHLWLWAINQHLDWAYQVARAWGFNESVNNITWAKRGLGLGRFQCNSEQLLLFRKGGPVDNAFGRTGGTWFNWPKPKQHSRKPDGAFALVERVSPGPYLEMFARYPRTGWLQMGDQLTAQAEGSRR